MKLADVADALSGHVIGDAELDIRRVVHPADAAGQEDLALALSDDALKALADCRAGAVVAASTDIMGGDTPVVVYTGSERTAVAILTALFDPGPAHAPGVHPTAVVADDAVLGEGVSVGAGSVIGPGCVVGAHTRLLANVTLGADLRLGDHCRLHPGVVVGDRVEIGDRVIIHANAVIGSDGFSFLPAGPGDKGGSGGPHPRRIHALGTVIIEDDVEIGAASTIDRATLRATRIGRATKIDNQVQIAHNVVVGEACLICGKAGIAGSATLGDRVIMAADTGVSDHVTVGDDAILIAGAGVVSAVEAGEQVVGQPAVPRATYAERYSNVARLSRIIPKFNALLKRVSALEETAQPTGRADRADVSGGDK